MKLKYTLLFLVFFFILSGGRSIVVAETVQPVGIVYALPFPGILPNHPLYFFKSLRDTLIEKMITNDIKKAEFYILQADKQLQMSLLLVDGKSTELAVSTRNNAYMFREKSFATLTSAKEKNIEIPRYVIEKLLVSAKKHKEVLQDKMIDVNEITNLIVKIEALLTALRDKK